MNKRQIYKVHYKQQWGGKESTCYGICIDNEHLLLEDMTLLLAEKNQISRPIIQNNGYYSSIAAHLDKSQYMFLSLQEMSIKAPNATDALSEVDVNATRNVPGKIREALEGAYESVSKMLKMEEKLNKLLIEYLEERGKLNDQVIDVPEICRASRGTITQEEFAEVFKENLSDEVRYACDHSAVKGYNGMAGNYNISMVAGGQVLHISREVDIEKWATPSYSFLEYDDTRQLDRNLDSKAYDADLKKYSRPLPVKAQIHESLNLGDKNYLSYYGGYNIQLKSGKELTAEYAKELAEKFCGIDRTLESDEEEEEERDLD